MNRTSDHLPTRRNIVTATLDLLYPPVCELCADPLRDNRWLCDHCASRLPRLEAPFCDRCAEPVDGAVEGSIRCPNCHQLEFAFRFARPAYDTELSTVTAFADFFVAPDAPSIIPGDPPLVLNRLRVSPR